MTLSKGGQKWTVSTPSAKNRGASTYALPGEREIDFHALGAFARGGGHVHPVHPQRDSVHPQGAHTVSEEC